MKRLLLLAALLGVIALPVALVAQLSGFDLPTWLTVERIFLASAIVGIVLLLVHDYAPRPSLPSIDASTPAIESHLDRARHAAALEFDRAAALLHTHDSTVTVVPL